VIPLGEGKTVESEERGMKLRRKKVDLGDFTKNDDSSMKMHDFKGA